MLPVKTDRLELRDFTMADDSAVHVYASDPVVTRYLWWGPNSKDETHRFLLKARQEANATPRQNFELAIVDRDSGRLIGGCSLLVRRAFCQEYELGYCLERDAWGKGYGSEAIRALTTFGFTSVAAHRIYALVDPENAPSSRLLGKLGFRREGHLRKDTWISGEWRDTWIHALLQDEWVEAVKGG